MNLHTPELLFCTVIFKPCNAAREERGDCAAYRNPPQNMLIISLKKKKEASERNDFIDLINSSKSPAGLLILCMFFIVV